MTSPRVVDEDAYTEGLATVVQQRFFPDLPRLRSEAIGLEAVDPDSSTREIDTMDSVPSIMTYQSQVTSEDNASFADLMREERAQKEARREALKPRPREWKRTRPASIVWRAPSAEICTWTDDSSAALKQGTAQLALPMPRGSKQVRATADVVPHATRFTPEMAANPTSIIGLSTNSNSQHSGPAVDYERGTVNGYTLLGANEIDASRRLSSSFRVPDTPRRELLLRQHVDRTPKSVARTPSTLLLSTRGSRLTGRTRVIDTPKFSWTPSANARTPKPPRTPRQL
ncbi:stress response protein Bis1 [Schizosaccharomyces japonicus yFS275]|uniref:Stress response protein Bis1 n=1 Tax=Schizosaccharomyces japonicus (strain yFS275 / FY16936) TaxID=402676 RepID=B6K252_SCHJY|nr:stress response protein Bis1 [Schizosaccharomyces japonicus yFS275]EEB07233.1 stress response protein Bis1 [Schizosaccharomyces japonicus yFS275]